MAFMGAFPLLRFRLVSFCVSALVTAAAAENITGYIYCDNHFQFYFNGVLRAEDPISFTPHQAVKVEFEYDGVSEKVYAIMCQDYASSSGYEYTQTTSPQLGDGSLLAEFSDGTRTGSHWKGFTVTFGPTDASIAAGCSSSNLAACAVEDRGLPANWFATDFDDSSWTAVTEYTTAQAGWGRAPTYTNGQCGTLTSPDTRANANPSTVATTEDQCLDPKTVLCGGDEDCTGMGDGKMVWGADLERDNKMLFRYKAAATCSLDPAAASSAPTCTATARTQQRVRRELRDLSADQWSRVVNAIWTMKNTSLADGQASFGANFKPYDYFVYKHAVAVGDSRGDMGHFSSAFATWHAAFVLEFETTLLAIDSQIEGLPYWDATHNILTADYFGSGPGTGTNSEVIDGKFPNFPVSSSFDASVFSSLMATVTGATNTYPATGNSGYLRGAGTDAANAANPLQTSVVTRYGQSWTFSSTAQIQCGKGNQCWNDWYSCIEGGHTSGNLHSGAHATMGGRSSPSRGDFEDPVTSPNDPIFMFHHANTERNRIMWMQYHSAEKSVFYGFTRWCHSMGGNSCPTEGIGLTDVVGGGLFPFTSAQLGLEPALSSPAVTHADILCHVGPTTAPFRYADPLGDQGSDTSSNTGGTQPPGGGGTCTNNGNNNRCCGDGFCDGPETATSCATDCGSNAGGGDTTTAANAGGAGGDTTTAASAGGDTTTAASAAGDTTTTVASAGGDTTTAASAGGETTTTVARAGGENEDTAATVASGSLPRSGLLVPPSWILLVLGAWCTIWH